jgi:hypothetical protein
MVSLYHTLFCKNFNDFLPYIIAHSEDWTLEGKDVQGRKGEGGKGSRAQAPGEARELN